MYALRCCRPPGAFHMRHQVTALRRRPHTFETLRGQSFVAQALSSSVCSANISNAYLFSGPHGVGKTSAARLLAAALHGTGRQCIAQSERLSTEKTSIVYADWISGALSVDVIEIDGASHTGINDVRTIREQVLYPPIEYPYKVYIIDEVHMLSQSAFNALLKTIEEPPEYIVFIFATTELQKVPATIRSRCQQFQFQKIQLDDLVSSLHEAAQEEGIPLHDRAAHLIAAESQGSLRDAYMLFDQIKATRTDAEITETLVLDRLGLHGLVVLRKLALAILSEQKTQAETIFQELLAGGSSPANTLTFLMRMFRTAYCLKLELALDDLGFFGITASHIEKLSLVQCEYAVKCCLETLKEITPQLPR